MTEGITYNPLGTVEVSFDDTTYKLGRPKMRQFKYFVQALQQASDQATDAVRELTRQAEKAQEAHDKKPTDKTQAELDRLNEEARRLGRNPFYESTVPILADMFTQLGDRPLPADPDDWPAWLGADSSIPNAIVTHWRNSPKVSGAPPPM